MKHGLQYRILFLLLLCLVTTISTFAQTLEEDVQAFIEKYEDEEYYDEDGLMLKEFYGILSAHPESIDYSFDKVQSIWYNARGHMLNIVDSDDGRLRFYEDVGGSAYNTYRLAVQYRTDKGIVFLHDPLCDFNPDDEGSLYPATTMIRKMSDSFYMARDIMGMGADGYLLTEYIFTIDGNVIRHTNGHTFKCPLFVPGPPSNQWSGWDDFTEDSEGHLLCPIPIDGDDGFSRIASGIFSVFDRNNGYRCLGTVCNPKYHEKVKGYKRYIAHFTTALLRIHVDLMPDNSYRLAIWNIEQPLSDMPQGLIYKGVFHGDSNTFHFVIKNFTYTVGYTSVDENGFYEGLYIEMRDNNSNKTTKQRQCEYIQAEQNSDSNDSHDELPISTASDYSFDIPDYASEYGEDIYNSCVETLKKWDAAHFTHDVSAFADVYWDNVKYYQRIFSVSQIQESKRQLFSKYPDFYQYVDNVVVEPFNSEITYVKFVKHVRTEKDGEFTSYPSYLVFNGDSILAESDETTDSNIERKQSKSTPVPFPVNNNMTLDEIFCNANIGKTISVSYWDLVGKSEENEEGPLAKAMAKCCGENSLRCSMDGEIRKLGNGIYSCDGRWSIGEGYFYLIWKYDSYKKELTTER